MVAGPGSGAGNVLPSIAETGVAPPALVASLVLSGIALAAIGAGRSLFTGRGLLFSAGWRFAKENDYALPPLSLLIPLSQGKFEPKMADVLRLTDRLEAGMPAMLAEHKDIAAALKKLHDAATAEHNAAGIHFAEHLAAHARKEEELTYPTALLIGKYVKLRAAQGAR